MPFSHKCLINIVTLLWFVALYLITGKQYLKGISTTLPLFSCPKSTKRVRATVKCLCSPPQAASSGFWLSLLATCGPVRVQAHYYAHHVALWAAIPHEGRKPFSFVSLTGGKIPLVKTGRPWWNVICRFLCGTTGPAGLELLVYQRCPRSNNVIIRVITQSFCL